MSRLRTRAAVRSKDHALKIGSVEAQLIALVLLAFLLGGGGVGAALFNLVVQLAALLILAVNLPAVARFVRCAPRVILALIAATLLIPLIQLIPLPPAVWHALPGRDLVAQSYELIASQADWSPISVAPARTFVVFLGLLPPLTIVILGWQLSSGGRQRLLVLIVALGLVSALLGAVQLLSGGTMAMIQSEALGAHEIHGPFANRNSMGLFFVLVLIALTALGVENWRRKGVVVAAVTGFALISLCLVLTRSRSSMALGVMVLPVMIYGLVQAVGLTRKQAIMVSAGVVAVVIAAVAGLAWSGNANVQASTGRFSDIEQVRPLIWADTVGAIRRYAPVGSGMGTFDEVFQVDESIEYLTNRRAGRAHNDWLEIALEAGIAGVALVLAWTMWLLAAGIAVVRRRGSATAFAAFCILASMALQSILDYPLRNEALLCVAALAFVMLSSAVQPVAATEGSGGRRMFGA